MKNGLKSVCESRCEGRSTTVSQLLFRAAGRSDESPTRPSAPCRLGQGPGADFAERVPEVEVDAGRILALRACVGWRRRAQVTRRDSRALAVAAGAGAAIRAEIQVFIQIGRDRRVKPGLSAGRIIVETHAPRVVVAPSRPGALGVIRVSADPGGDPERQHVSGSE